MISLVIYRFTDSTTTVHDFDLYHFFSSLLTDVLNYNDIEHAPYEPINIVPYYFLVINILRNV